jgi:hypothetical protein
VYLTPRPQTQPCRSPVLTGRSVEVWTSSSSNLKPTQAVATSRGSVALPGNPPCVTVVRFRSASPAVQSMPLRQCSLGRQLPQSSACKAVPNAQVTTMAALGCQIPVIAAASPPPTTTP